VGLLRFSKRFLLLSATKEFVRAKKLQVLLAVTKTFTGEKMLIFGGSVAAGVAVETWAHYFRCGCLKLLHPAAVFGRVFQVSSIQMFLSVILLQGQIYAWHVYYISERSIFIT